MAVRDIAATLRVRDFRMLWAGSFAASFAMNMQQVARGWLVYTLTSSALDLAWVTLAFMLPMALFSLWGGVLADRLPKRRVIISAQTLNGLATIVLGAIIFTGNVTFWDFIWFGALNGTVLALSVPARQAFVPELIPERLIFSGMSLTTTAWNVSRIVGPAFAGFLIAWVAAGDTASARGVGIVYFIIAALYLVAAVTTVLVSRPGIVRERDGKSPLEDIADGMRYVRANRSIFGLIMLSIVPFLFAMPVNALLPAFNEDILGGGPDDLGLLMSAMGGGAIVGSLTMASMGGLRHKGRWLVATCVIWGVSTILVGLSETVLLASAVVAAFGWLSAWNMSLNRGLLQLRVSDRMRGRVMSIDMMSHGLMPLGVIPIGFVAERYDVAVALVCAGLAFVVAVAALALLSSSVRQVDRPGGQAAGPAR